MDFYVISPTSNLELMELGDRIFVLAHLYISNPEYRSFVKKQKEAGKFITLDNSVAEGALVTEEILLQCVEDLLPNEVIAPDVLFDKDQTLANFFTFKEKLKKFPTVKLFGCPQGDTLEEWLLCYREMLPFADVIGLSKGAVSWAFTRSSNDENISHSRHIAYDILKAYNMIQKPIHCLGAGDPWEFEYYKGDPMMRSTDSCFTVWAAINYIPFTKDGYLRVKTPRDYFEMDLHADQIRLAKENIKKFRSLLN